MEKDNIEWTQKRNIRKRNVNLFEKMRQMLRILFLYIKEVCRTESYNWNTACKNISTYHT